jgi:hypothetical protein
MKTRTDLTGAPHVVVTLIGKFKGELGTRHHLLALASKTLLGIKLQCWLERLMKTQAQEGHKLGPAFENQDGLVGLMSDYDGILYYFLGKIQTKAPDMLPPLEVTEANYSFNRTFRRTAEGRAGVANLDSGVQNAMNRWRKIEEAKGKHPRFNMAD